MPTALFYEPHRTLVQLLHSYTYFCNNITSFNHSYCDLLINFDEKLTFLQGKNFVHIKNIPKKTRDF